jgi:hypothetical protein
MLVGGVLGPFFGDGPEVLGVVGYDCDLDLVVLARVAVSRREHIRTLDSVMAGEVPAPAPIIRDH